ncbi:MULTISPECIES: aspartate aminotransferase family protein [Mycolicibacterium]|uniref:Acetylornithine aminotransferase apoenzyme n=5 Tax=Mycolicibacterium TaxID=1866885 RepID=A1T9U8_MYCVP|nr:MULTISPECIES: aminotransferase class III-fold pyridoxal phosphate-dependent enzyme [Mycolicibacterium]ABM13948.1 acetylornithine aminotransferase apoenzyme [Mycolicibacterium vanbaalenii PYR-1]MCV7126786.1 aminotransferase class III-fold pyridoxal phosphate-dependent enzyme [Mycolicibacterium vanbaalenii PYR-1]MDN4518712.1 aminotransferase class III-fold pyridoxal phosphate-dependent enzyme [Mycolicibacterium austroafricanum]QRZ04361.1 aminotransferase class III-fold pyridoxal phosphate-depe
MYPTMSGVEIESYRDRFVRHLSQTVPGRKEFVVAEARGCTVTTADGRSYLDMTSGIGVANVGHCHPRVVEAIQAQAARYAHVNVYGRFVVPEQVELVERLTGAAGAGFDMAYLTSSGAESTECAMKLARKHTGRPKFVAFERAYHGRTLGALSVSWREEWRAPFEPLLDEVMFVPYDSLTAAAAAVDDRTAAVIVEPIQGEGGIRVPSDDFLPGLRELCDATGALLIVDEVQGGMGRSGRWFAHQHTDVRPDIITMAKAVGGGLPLGAVLASAELFATFVDPPLSHLTTMGGNPVACAAGIAAFDVIADGLLDRVVEAGEYLRTGLAALCDEFAGLLVDVRGRGLWCAIELSVDANPVVARMQQLGVLVGSVLNQSGTVRIMPPLVISDAEIDTFVGVLRTVLGEVAS